MKSRGGISLMENHHQGEDDDDPFEILLNPGVADEEIRTSPGAGPTKRHGRQSSRLLLPLFFVPSRSEELI